MPTQRVEVLVEAFYELCPHDERTAPYFQIEPTEQARVMHFLLNEVTRAVGGGVIARGERLLRRWADRKRMLISLPLINGHPFLTEQAASAFLAARAREVDSMYVAEVEVSDQALDCAGCIPRPPLHLSGRGIYLMLDGEPLTVSAPTTMGQITSRIGVRMTVETPFNPSAAGGHGDHEAHGAVGAAAPSTSGRGRRRGAAGHAGHAGHTASERVVTMQPKGTVKRGKKPKRTTRRRSAAPRG